MSKLYPNLSYEDERTSSTHLQSNCGQIFSKGTEITKDILEKFEGGDIGPKKASLCGRNFNTRQLWVLAGLTLLFSTSCLCMALMFGTNTFDSYVLSNLILSNSTVTFQIWKGPLVKTFLKVYVFNYTNVKEYEDGTDAKLHVEEIGPYVYDEVIERVNVRFHPNGTVSYQEKFGHSYREDLSTERKINETITVPNLPLLSAAAMGKKSYYVARVAMSTILKGLSSKAFVNLEINKFLWGYDDTLYALAKSVLSFQKKLPFDKIGLLASRSGLSDDVYNVHTGIHDISKMQQMDTLNGKNRMTQWATDKCNKIKGSSSSNFSPFDIREKRPVSLYNKDLCRSLPLVYDKDVKILNGKIPAHRYVMPTNVFDAPDSNPENNCYCDEETQECPPQGLFNAEACSFGTPVYISFPHFYNADDSVRQGVTGLKENPPPLDNYVNIHPTLGFIMGGRTQIQLNVQVHKSFGMDQLEMFDDDIILPIAWFEIALEDSELPDMVKDSIYLTSVTVPAIEMCLKYGSLLAAAVTLTAIVIILRAKWIKRQQKLHDNPS